MKPTPSYSLNASLLPHRFSVQTTLLLSSLFGLLCTTTTYIRIPLPWTPVPIAVQPLGALLAALFFGARYGCMSQLVYLAALPCSVYAGYQPLYGPLCGYLIGMPLSSYLFGRMLTHIHLRSSLYKGASRTRFALTVLAASATICFIYILGSLGLLMWNYSHAHPLPSFIHLLTQSTLPFIAGDIIKVCIVSLAATHLLLRKLS